MDKTRRQQLIEEGMPSDDELLKMAREAYLEMEMTPQEMMSSIKCVRQKAEREEWDDEELTLVYPLFTYSANRLAFDFLHSMKEKSKNDSH